MSPLPVPGPTIVAADWVSPGGRLDIFDIPADQQPSTLTVDGGRLAV